MKLQKRAYKSNNNTEYLSFLSTVNLKNYIRTYYGNLVQDIYKNEHSIEVFLDKSIGIYFKIAYLVENDLDLTNITEYVFIGQFGPLYNTENGLKYKSIEHQETKNFYKLITQNISNKQILNDYDRDFIEVHKQALIDAKNYSKRLEKESFKRKINRIELKYNELLEDLKNVDLSALLETKTK